MPRKQRPPRKTSRYTGVHVRSSTKTPRWIAQIKYRQTNVYLGSFTCEEDAAWAYDDAKREAIVAGLWGKGRLEMNLPQNRLPHVELAEIFSHEPFDADVERAICREAGAD